MEHGSTIGQMTYLITSFTTDDGDDDDDGDDTGPPLSYSCFLGIGCCNR